MIILNITKVELNWFLVSEYDPNCEMETNCGDDTVIACIRLLWKVQ